MICVKCKSKRFKKKDGLLTCSNGHVVSGFIEQAADETFTRSRGYRKKKQKRVSKAIDDSIQFCPKSIRLEIQQHGLLQITDALIQKKHFPIEFKDVVLNLWLMYVSLYEPTMADRQVKKSNWSFSSMAGSEASSGVDTANDTDGATDIASSYATSEDSDGTNASYRRRRRDPSNIGFHELLTSFSPQILLAILYLSARLLLLPIFHADISRWANNGEIPYFFTEKSLTESHHRGFNVRYTGVEIKAAPEFTLQKIITLMSRFYVNKFKITFPPPNVPLLQYRISRDLGLSSQNLAHVILIHKKIYPGYIPETLSAKSKSSEQPLSDSQIIAPFLFFLKIMFASSPGTDSVRVKSLPKELSKISTNDIELDPSRWSEYLSFCQELFVDLKNSTSIYPPLLEMIKNMNTNEFPADSTIKRNSLKLHDLFKIDASTIEIKSYACDDKAGYFPSDYGSALVAACDIIGMEDIICLEKKVRKIEYLLLG